MEPVRLGFVGCGSHARHVHIPLASAMPDHFSIVAAYDADSAALDRVPEITPPVRRASSLDELVEDRDIEAVVVATPDALHLEAIEKALAARKHILCEKPLWTGAEDNERGCVAVRKAAESGIVLTSCHPKRFEPWYGMLRDRLHGDSDYRKRFGRVTEFNYRFFFHEPANPKHDSLMVDHLNHELDIMRFILHPSRVALARIRDGRYRYHVQGMRAEDRVALSFAGYRYLENRVYRNRAEIVFECGRVWTKSALENGIVRADLWEENLENDAVRHQAFQPRGAEEPFRAIMQNFAESIRGTSENYLTPEDLVANTVPGNILVACGEYAN